MNRRKNTMEGELYEVAYLVALQYCKENGLDKTEIERVELQFTFDDKGQVTIIAVGLREES
jgi:hypothetical protein